MDLKSQIWTDTNMKLLTVNRGLAFAVRWPNLDLKVSIVVS